MKKQWLITLLLLVGALNLYILVQMELERTDEQAPQENLTTLDPEQIRSIEIIRTADTLVFNRNGDQWLMTSPLQGSANAERMTELRALAVITPLGQYDIDQIDLSRYGLKPAQLSVRLNNTMIAFGDINPANQRRYVLTENRLFLLADNIFPILQLPAADFIE